MSNKELIRKNKPLPAGLTTTGDLGSLYGYAHPLPAGLTTTGDLYGLYGYAHPLPAGLTTTGHLYGLYGYAHPLPAGLTTTDKGRFFEILTVAEAEIPALQKAMRDGKIDGSAYEGPL